MPPPTTSGAMRRLGLGVAVLSIAVLLVALATAAPAAASGSPSSEVPSAVAAHAASLAPVFVHFKPNHVSAAQGGTVSFTAIVHDNGTHSYTATSCKLWFRYGSSGAWTLLHKCLSPSYFPANFTAHSKTKFTASVHVSSTFPTGTYQWKLVLLGTYHGVSESSHPGILSVTIT